MVLKGTLNITLVKVIYLVLTIILVKGEPLM